MYRPRRSIPTESNRYGTGDEILNLQGINRKELVPIACCRSARQLNKQNERVALHNIICLNNKH